MTESVVNTPHNPVELTGTTDSNGNPAGNIVVDGQLSGTLQAAPIVAALTSTVVVREFDPPINGMIVDVIANTALTSDEDRVVLCAGAPTNSATDPTAAAWLTETNNAPRVTVKPNDGKVSVAFSSPISHVHLKANATAAPDVSIEGVV